MLFLLSEHSKQRYTRTSGLGSGQLRDMEPHLSIILIAMESLPHRYLAGQLSEKQGLVFVMTAAEDIFNLQFQESS